MGQISLPVTNKSGVSSFWQTSGGAYFDKATFYSKDYFLRRTYKMLLSHNINLVRYIKQPAIPSKTLEGFKKLPYTTYKTPKGVYKISYNTSSTYNADYLKLTENLTEYKVSKSLPTYSGDLLLLKKNSTIIVISRYLPTVKGEWSKKNNYAINTLYQDNNLGILKPLNYNSRMHGSNIIESLF